MKRERVYVKRPGLVMVVMVTALAACMPTTKALPPPETLPPAPSERMFRLLGQKELADPVFHRSMHAGEQAFNRGDHATAERYYSIGLKRGKEIGHDFLIAQAASYLFDAYAAQGKYEEAEQTLRDSLTSLEKAHPKKADYLRRYAALLRRMGREAEAAGIEARINDIRAK